MTSKPASAALLPASLNASLILASPDCELLPSQANQNRRNPPVGLRATSLGKRSRARMVDLYPGDRPGGVDGLGDLATSLRRADRCRSPVDAVDPAFRKNGRAFHYYQTRTRRLLVVSRWARVTMPSSPARNVTMGGMTMRFGRVSPWMPRGDKSKSYQSIRLIPPNDGHEQFSHRTNHAPSEPDAYNSGPTTRVGFGDRLTIPSTLAPVVPCACTAIASFALMSWQPSTKHPSSALRSRAFEHATTEIAVRHERCSPAVPTRVVAVLA